MEVTLRYSENIEKDFARGYSYAGWGINSYPTEAECREEWPDHIAEYSEDFGGWMPILRGLCCVCSAWGETWEDALQDALDAFKAKSFALPFGDAPLWAFEAECIGADEYGYDLCRPVDGGRVERMDG